MCKKNTESQPRRRPEPSSCRSRALLLAELFGTFAKIGAFTFGGGYAMIALLEDTCVEKKGWLSSEELMNVIVVAESTPGPIAINCATYTGWRKAGLPGAVIATAGIVLPSFLLIFFIAQFFEDFISLNLPARALRGIRPAVGLVIMQAALRMGRKMLGRSAVKKQQAVLAVLFFLLFMLLNLLNIRLSVIWLMLAAGLIGLLMFRSAPPAGSGAAPAETPAQGGRQEAGPGAEKNGGTIKKEGR